MSKPEPTPVVDETCDALGCRRKASHGLALEISRDAKGAFDLMTLAVFACDEHAGAELSNKVMSAKVRKQVEDAYRSRVGGPINVEAVDWDRTRATWIMLASKP